MAWTIANEYLPTVPIPSDRPVGLFAVGLFALVTDGADAGGGGPLATVALSPTLIGQAPIVTSATGILDGDTYTLETGAIAVFAVGSSGGVVWRPAVNVLTPGVGEFVFDPYAGTVTLTLGDGFSLVDGQSVALIAAMPTVLSEVAQPVPMFARQVQLRSLSWSLSLEGHPSGSLELEANDVTLPAIRAQLSRGTEFSLYGIGFRCGPMRIATASRRDFPIGLHVVSIDMGGKWENYVDEPFVWRNLGQTTASQTDAAAGDEVVPASYDLVEIAARIGAVYQGPAGSVPVPENAGAGESTTFAQEVADFTRINGSTIDYTAADAIRMKPVAGGRVWDYRGSSLLQNEIVQEVGAISTPSIFMPSESLLMPEPVLGLPAVAPSPSLPTLREEEGTGIVIEWENVQLTGEFAEQAATDEEEDTLTQGGRSRWVRQRREITVLQEGDGDATSPPAGAVAVRDVSLNFDQSGPAKTLTLTRKEDGFIVLVEQWRYGYAFTARQAANDDGEIVGSPAAWWRVIEYTRKERQIDRGNTNYAYGWNTTGWRLGRFKQETASNPETLSLDSGDPELSLYQFQQVPINERERELLLQHRDYYDNLDIRDQQGELISYTLPNGETASIYLRNPNFAEPMFVAAHSREMVAFVSTPNPDSADGAPLPKLISGREEFSRMARKLEPGKKRRIRLGGQEQPGDRTADRYTDYSSQFTAQDGQYSNSLEDTQFQDYEGRPGEADRLPPEYTQEQPPEGNEGSTEADEAQGQRLYLLNSGAPTQALGQQKNYPRAATLEQALTAARTDATLENLEQGTREQITVLWNPDIRPGDQLIYEVGGEVRRRFVLDCQWKPEWTRDGMFGAVSLTVARWVDAGAALTLTTIDLPSQSGDPSSSDGNIYIGNVFNRNFTLGGLLAVNVQSRTLGNY